MPPEQQKVSFIDEQNLTSGRRFSSPLSGMTRMLVSRGIAANEAQANTVLLGIAIVAILIAVGVFWWSGGFGSSNPPPPAIESPGAPSAPVPGNMPGSIAPSAPAPSDSGGTSNPSFDPSLYRRQ